jgi:hypothetical protein
VWNEEAQQRQRRLLLALSFIISGSLSLWLFSFLHCWSPCLLCALGGGSLETAWAPVQHPQLSPTTASCKVVGGREEEGLQEASRALSYTEALQTPSFLAGIFLRRLFGSDELREQELHWTDG